MTQLIEHNLQDSYLALLKHFVLLRTLKPPESISSHNETQTKHYA